MCIALVHPSAKKLCSLHFAGDKLVIAKADLEYMRGKLQEEYEGLSLTLNSTNKISVKREI
jgi:hypothetical protein